MEDRGSAEVKVGGRTRAAHTRKTLHLSPCARIPRCRPHCDQGVRACLLAFVLCCSPSLPSAAPRRQPYVKVLSGLARGGTTLSDANGAITPGIQTNADIGAAGYSSIKFAHAGVTKPVATGECALQDVHKKLALSRVEAERLSRAKFLEERKGKQVRLSLPPVLRHAGVLPCAVRAPSAHAATVCARASILSTHAGNGGRQSK